MTNLWYVFPLENLTSGLAHASENVKVRSVSEGRVIEAAIAAPIDDPAFEGTEVSS